MEGESTLSSYSSKNKARKRNRNSEDEPDLENIQPKNKKAKLPKQAGKYGFLGKEGYKKFSDGIPYYIPTRAFGGLVDELKNKSSAAMTNAAVVAVFDMSGVGKSTLFKEAAKSAGAYCFASNVSAGGPFISLQGLVLRTIEPLFSNGMASAGHVMPVLERIFNHAFAIMLSEIKDLLVAGLTESFVMLTRNGLDSALSSSDAPKSQGILEEVAKLLNGQSALILTDEIQLFATHLTTIKTSCLPDHVYLKYNKERNEYSWRDFLIVAFYRSLFSLALTGRQFNILFCQAGTYNMENIFVHSPCKPIQRIDSCLPLELFDMAKCKMLFDHFWRFKITDAEKEDLLGQLLGPPRIMQYFFTELCKIEKSPELVTYMDLQKAVDASIAYLEVSIYRGLSQIVEAYQTYVKIVLYPEDYGGKVEDKLIVYQPDTEGFNILQEKGSAFADSSVLRIYRRQMRDFVIEMPSRATQLVMSHLLFNERKEQYNDLAAVLNNKGNAFETLLLFECCELTSPLFKLMGFVSEPKITFKAVNYSTFKKFTEVLTRKEDFIAKIQDSDGGHEQGAHKIDIVFRLGDTLVAIQAVCQEFTDTAVHQMKLNTKLREAVKAFAQHANSTVARNIIFVFASMFDFKMTSTTDELIAEQKNFKTVVLADFRNCIFPFYLLCDKEKLRDGKKIRELIKMYHQRVTGKPAQSIDFFSLNSNESDLQNNSAIELKKLEIKSKELDLKREEEARKREEEARKREEEARKTTALEKLFALNLDEGFSSGAVALIENNDIVAIALLNSDASPNSKKEKLARCISNKKI